MIVTSLSEYSYSQAPYPWKSSKEPLSFCSIYYIVSGEDNFYQSATDNFEFQPGTLYILPQDTEYWLISSPTTPATVLYFHLNTSEKIKDITIHPVKENSFLYDILMVAKKYVYVDDNNIMSIMANLILNTVLSSPDKLVEDNSKKIFERAKIYIDTHVNEDISVKDVCKFINLDASYFIRKFKNLYGVSPKQYIIDKKMATALVLLQDKQKISYVSGMLGYASDSYFIKVFKTKFGITPKEYCNLYKNGKDRSSFMIRMITEGYFGDNFTVKADINQAESKVPPIPYDSVKYPSAYEAKIAKENEEKQ